MMKYYVYTSADNIQDLIENVNTLVDLGFEPFGTVYQDTKTMFNYQTLSKKIPPGLTAERASDIYFREHAWAIANNDDNNAAADGDEPQREIQPVAIVEVEASLLQPSLSGISKIKADEEFTAFMLKPMPNEKIGELEEYIFDCGELIGKLKFPYKEPLQRLFDEATKKLKLLKGG